MLRGIRAILEPHGFTYSGRALRAERNPMSITIEIERYRWAPARTEVFDVVAEFSIGAGDDEESVRIGVARRIRRPAAFYGLAPDDLSTEPIIIGDVITDFRRTLLPIVLHNDSVDKFVPALLAEEIAPGIENPLDPLGQARDAYRWAVHLGLDDLRSQAVDLLRSLAEEPSEREAVLFMWNILRIQDPLSRDARDAQDAKPTP